MRLAAFSGYVKMCGVGVMEGSVKGGRSRRRQEGNEARHKQESRRYEE
jgi:hypothetical protein